MSAHLLPPAALAFDAIAPVYEARFGEWKSVAAQRRAVRDALLGAFPDSGHILELGGGTGIDAAWLAKHGFRILLTDASPAMVGIARERLAAQGSHAETVVAETLDEFAERYLDFGGEMFDGAFSNFAPLNCVGDLTPVARGLARLVRKEAPVMLVVFGACAPGEMITEILRGRPSQALRRLRRGSVPARLGGRQFEVFYHRGHDLIAAMAPWFRFERRLGVGVFVPPSGAEPWISRHPSLLAVLERLDRMTARPLAPLGDHVLYHFVRTESLAP